MEKQLIQELKKKLLEEKDLLKKDLLKFADKDKKIPDDYDTRFPYLERSSAPDEDAEEVEQYETLLALEHSLELRLKDVNDALEKIENGQYGECENCHQKIEIARLKANPAARFCMKCSNQKMA
ncbi:MAG TPA: TraR/DksA C4-type zinc finger protein [Candidatus Paceibacterota bacterium]|jgi:DnaK suppressor protein|nr:TraR/DksA C4-type zinc finger protein [Candidatus Paceibacterota bacterium]